MRKRIPHLADDDLLNLLVDDNSDQAFKSIGSG